MSDAFPLCERDQAIGWTIGLYTNKRRAQGLGEPDVLLQRVGVARV